MPQNKLSPVSIDVPTNDPGVIYELVKQIFKKGYVIDDYQIDLTSASKENPIRIRLDDQSEHPSSPPHKYSSDAYTFYLSKDSKLYLHMYTGRDTNIINTRIELTLSKNLRVDSSEDIVLKPNDKKRYSRDISSNLSIAFMNRDKIEDYINKINLFSQKQPPDDNVSIVFSRDIEQNSTHIYKLNNIIRILKYDHYINTIDNVPYQDQCEVVDFLINNLKNDIVYNFKGFVITKNSKRDVISVTFLGIPLAFFNDDDPPRTYFKYFRHRGISFLANVIRENRDEFEQRIHMLSLKHDVGV